MNRLYSAECVTAVKETARRNLVIAVFGTEVCLTMSARQVPGGWLFRLRGGGHFGWHERRSASCRSSTYRTSGCVPVNAMQLLLEFRRDWARSEDYDEVIREIKAHTAPGWR